MRYKQRLGALSGLAFAVGLTVSQGAIASPLTAGFDLLSTPDGTVTLNLGAIGLVTFNGNPIDTLRAAFGMSPLGLGTGPLGTDTVMLRDSGISAFPDTIALELVSLSLKSAGQIGKAHV